MFQKSRFLLFAVLYVLPFVLYGASSLEELEQAITQNRSKVREFEIIQKKAEEFGVRVYLFGGTAAAFAHYVKWDLERQNGHSEYQEEKFDYHWTNIYRSTQDADLVVDGTTEQAQKLENYLVEQLPHLQGSKTVWEVRLLRENFRNKIALLNSYEFLNQHSDSHSVGLIEITNSMNDEPVIKDLRHWNEERPPFLRDVESGEIHFYFSDLHKTTKRYLDGLNPPIFSVIRYLIKALQFESKIPAEDASKIKQIINDFSTENDLKTSYAKNWIEKNAKKLFHHALNIEYAWDLLESFGVRNLLAGVSPSEDLESLSTLMNREPLRTSPLGLGSGRKAKEIFEDDLIFAHETRDFLAYESITKSKKGEANVFISRPGHEGESAMHGYGFYMRKGRFGAAGTGITIRAYLHADAREGTDFVTVGDCDYILVRNKSAIRLIFESLKLSPLHYILILRDQNLSGSDKGVLFQIRSRIFTEISNLDKNSAHKISELVVEAFNNENPLSVVIIEGRDLLKASKWKEISSRVETYLESPETIRRRFLELLRLSRDHYGWGDLFLRHILMRPDYLDYHDLFLNIVLGSEGKNRLDLPAPIFLKYLNNSKYKELIELVTENNVELFFDMVRYYNPLPFDKKTTHRALKKIEAYLKCELNKFEVYSAEFRSKQIGHSAYSSSLHVHVLCPLVYLNFPGAIKRYLDVLHHSGSNYISGLVSDLGRRSSEEESLDEVILYGLKRLQPKQYENIYALQHNVFRWPNSHHLKKSFQFFKALVERRGTEADKQGLVEIEQDLKAARAKYLKEKANVSCWSQLKNLFSLGR